ncbi:MAG: fluoride efflux transporter FluC [Sporichthyaceae bacterium]
MAPSTSQGPTFAPRVLAAVALGGVLGSLARYGAGRIWPEGTVSDIPVTTLGVNLVGCALLGVFMVLVTERGPVHPLWRPFLGPGFCGGFTTFSVYAVYVVHLRFDGVDGEGSAAPFYGVITPLGAVLAIVVATWVTRRACGLSGPAR